MLQDDQNIQNCISQRFFKNIFKVIKNHVYQCFIPIGLLLIFN